MSADHANLSEQQAGLSKVRTSKTDKTDHRSENVQRSQSGQYISQKDTIPDPEVKVTDLVKRYKELTAIDHMNLEIRKGEIFGLLGPNGSGKTTLIHCILALLNYEQGDVYIFGEKMTPFANHLKQQIGLVPQEPALYNELTVYENIDYYCGLYITDKAERKKLVERAINFVELQDFKKFRPRKLSGGLLRRLNLACGIAHRPRLIFFDEPTVAVDPQSRNKILEGIKQLNREGATIIYTSHYMEEVEFLCDRLAILDKGKVLVEGSSEHILSLSSVTETVEASIFNLSEKELDMLKANLKVSQIDYRDGLLTLHLFRNGDTLLTILHELEKLGIEPSAVQSKKPSLNDVFLEITGKDLRDHG